MASMTTPVFGGEQLLLPTMDAPVIPLRRPKPGTLQDLALNRLLVGDVLNHPEFFAESGSWRLAAVIDQLNGMGWPISKRHIFDFDDDCLKGSGSRHRRWHAGGRIPARSCQPQPFPIAVV